MSRLLSFANLLVGGLLLFALSDIASWSWFSAPAARLIAFILSVVLVGNAVILSFGSEEPQSRMAS
ncbi:MAG: hypothetical protein NTZ04_01405 [Chloroflexi bacterium]|jgi:hypothetical protein|nr:hypothetical protein [Chloroflexota bacterium]